jgi:hypothetical protein
VVALVIIQLRSGERIMNWIILAEAVFTSILVLIALAMIWQGKR